MFKNSTKKTKAKAPSTRYWSLEVLWTNFHLRPLDRLIVVFPVFPLHSLTVLFTIEVQTIEVWVMAIFVPPGSFITHSTVAWVGVIIPIFRGKWWATMIAERITSRAWEKIKTFTRSLLLANKITLFTVIYLKDIRVMKIIRLSHT